MKRAAALAVGSALVVLGGCGSNDWSPEDPGSNGQDAGGGGENATGLPSDGTDGGAAISDGSSVTFADGGGSSPDGGTTPDATSPASGTEGGGTCPPPGSNPVMVGRVRRPRWLRRQPDEVDSRRRGGEQHDRRNLESGRRLGKRRARVLHRWQREHAAARWLPRHQRGEKHRPQSRMQLRRFAQRREYELPHGYLRIHERPYQDGPRPRGGPDGHPAEPLFASLWPLRDARADPARRRSLAGILDDGHEPLHRELARVRRASTS